MIDKHKVNEKANRVKKGSEHKATIGYINSSMKNQRKAAEELGDKMAQYKDTIKGAINSVTGEDQIKLIELNNNINQLLAQAKKGGDINKIVSKLRALGK